MKRCVIIGGAEIADYNIVREYLKPDDFMVCCDSGLNHCAPLGIQPDLIVGDFDSHAKPETAVETIILPCEKDDTDTVYAVKEMLKRGFSDFLLIGVIGGRLDHSLGNIAILQMLNQAKKKAIAVDDFGELQVVSAETALISDRFSYFSLLAIGGDAEGICVRNAKYPLDNGKITCSYPYGISNEVLPGKTAEVRVDKGSLLLIRIR